MNYFVRVFNANVTSDPNITGSYSWDGSLYVSTANDSTFTCIPQPGPSNTYKFFQINDFTGANPSIPNPTTGTTWNNTHGQSAIIQSDPLLGWSAAGWDLTTDLNFATQLANYVTRNQGVTSFYGKFPLGAPSYNIYIWKITRSGDSNLYVQPFFMPGNDPAADFTI